MSGDNATYEISILADEKSGKVVVDPEIQVVPPGATIQWVVETGVARIIFPGPCAMELLAKPGSPAVGTVRETGAYFICLRLLPNKSLGGIAVLIVDP